MGDQCCLKAYIYEFWFGIRPMGMGLSTLNKKC